MEQKIKAVGTRTEVYKGKAKHTSGGLKKDDLIKNKGGKLVSKNASVAAKKNNNLEKAGYFTEKGKFGSVYKEPKENKVKKSKKSTNKKSPTKSRKSPSKNKTFSFF